MIGALVTAVAVCLAVVGLSDIFLSEKQKKAVDTRIIQLWMKLDDWSRAPPLAWISKYPIAALLSVTCYLILMLGLILPTKTPVWLLILTAAQIFVFYRAVGKPLEMMLSRLSWKVWVSVATTAIVTGFALYALLEGYLKPLVDDPSKTISVTASIIFAAALSTLLTLFSVSVFGLTPYIAGRAAMLLLSSLEFIVRRIAEFSKGPLLATAALLGILAALLKLLQ